jgi:hypothetical protein
MTGAAGHLVSHSGYGSLIAAPGVLLKGERKTPASRESPLRGAEGSRPRGPISQPCTTLARQHRGPAPAAPLPVSPSTQPPELLPLQVPGTAAAAGERTPKASHPKERKREGCSYRQGAIGHQEIREATRHPFPTPTR